MGAVNSIGTTFGSPSRRRLDFWTRSHLPCHALPPGVQHD